ncbi:PREDICTED: uncharacterized protein LOC109183136 [Ipomoea nil]|uniref:uncharacterized protein LOC109183136 n=1 Tax=Ipomoea nil TaxID=35883 RepID=UPI0009019DFA|nr:PREDICTED: uncharacterized protein LOC109183136 [Ipomoea nil]
MQGHHCYNGSLYWHQTNRCVLHITLQLLAISDVLLDQRSITVGSNEEWFSSSLQYGTWRSRPHAQGPENTVKVELRNKENEAAELEKQYMPSTIQELEAAILDTVYQANSILCLNPNALQQYKTRQRKLVVWGASMKLRGFAEMTWVGAGGFQAVCAAFSAVVDVSLPVIFHAVGTNNFEPERRNMCCVHLQYLSSFLFLLEAISLWLELSLALLKLGVYQM